MRIAGIPRDQDGPDTSASQELATPDTPSVCYHLRRSGSVSVSPQPASRSIQGFSGTYTVMICIRVLIMSQGHHSEL